eukprot:TRINITY_DN3244_c0_g1_i15.p2 TRINITY_DN3244_c0_g1~~TRINITY_DN3244_c0_g1_i15.p2  ORF type:complete len:112 (+),score=9.41 TRINITY_DN3244_c0_g1_i15:633-968(+)
MALYDTFHPSSPISFLPSIQKISQPAISLLKSPISHNEIKSTISQMKPTSTPGPDSLIASIYQVDTQKFASLLLLAFHQIQFSTSDMATFTESTVLGLDTNLGIIYMSTSS